MDESDGLLVLALVVELVLDEAKVDEVAHGRTCVPAHVVRIDVDLLQVPDHVVLVDDIGLRAGGRGGKTRRIVLVAVGVGDIDGYEKWKGLVISRTPSAAIPTRDPVAVVGKVEEQCFTIFITYLQEGGKVSWLCIAKMVGLERGGLTRIPTCTPLMGTSFVVSAIFAAVGQAVCGRLCVVRSAARLMMPL